MYIDIDIDAVGDDGEDEAEEHKVKTDEGEVLMVTTVAFMIDGDIVITMRTTATTTAAGPTTPFATKRTRMTTETTTKTEKHPTLGQRAGGAVGRLAGTVGLGRATSCSRKPLLLSLYFSAGGYDPHCRTLNPMLSRPKAPGRNDRWSDTGTEILLTAPYYTML